MSKRKFLAPAQKIAIVREHLIDGVPVSALEYVFGPPSERGYTWLICASLSGGLLPRVCCCGRTKGCPVTSSKSCPPFRASFSARIFCFCVCVNGLPLFTLG